MRKPNPENFLEFIVMLTIGFMLIFIVAVMIIYCINGSIPSSFCCKVLAVLGTELGITAIVQLGKYWSKKGKDKDITIMDELPEEETESED